MYVIFSIHIDKQKEDDDADFNADFVIAVLIQKSNAPILPMHMIDCLVTYLSPIGTMSVSPHFCKCTWYLSLGDGLCKI